MRPLVLVTPDFEEASWPRYVLKRAYLDAVVAAGGLPVIVGYDVPIDAYLSIARGVLVTGGAFDIPPEAYGESPRDGCGPRKLARTSFERELLEGALARQLPVLGVCGGMQLLNVVRGGSLHQDIAAELPGALAHEQTTPRDEPAHPLVIEPGTRVGQAAARARAAPAVNSTHHQAVARLGAALVVSARAQDGVVEAIEDPAARFIVGVQWHPELLVERAPWNLELYRQFVEAAR